MSQFNQTGNNNTASATLAVEGILCVPLQRSYILAELIVAAISFPLTLFLTISLLVFRSRLRSQTVNIYAANVVLACTVSNVARGFDTAWCYLGFRGPSYVSDGVLGEANVTAMHRFWQAQKTSVTAMYVVIAGGIAFVIMALRNNFIRVHRTVAGVIEAEPPQASDVDSNLTLFKRFSLWTARHPKLTACTFIAISWLFPFAFAIADVVANLCLPFCVCEFNYIPQNDSVGSACGSHCSAIWAPMSNLFLVFGCCIWVLYAVTLIALLIRSHIDFGRVRRQTAATTTSLKSKQQQQQHNRETGMRSLCDVDQHKFAPLCAPTEDTNSSKKTEQPSPLLLDTLYRQLLMLVIISLTYIVGTSFVVCFTLYCVPRGDYEMFRARNGDLITPAFILPTLCETFAAVALCLKMPNLRSAVRSMIVVWRNLMTCGTLRRFFCRR